MTDAINELVGLLEHFKDAHSLKISKDGTLTICYTIVETQSSEFNDLITMLEFMEQNLKLNR